MGTSGTESHARAGVFRLLLVSGRRRRTTLKAMAEPATRPPAGDDAPPFDPVAVDRAYLQERARRRVRNERSRARRRAGLRFWLVLVGLIAVSVLLTLTIWREVERLFGL
jgi:hypothetical protein